MVLIRKCKACGTELPEQPKKTIIIDNVEYETETHDFNKELSQITIPKGLRLWRYDECVKLHNVHRNELHLEDCWFFIEQPFTFNIEKNLVAGFWADSDRAGLNCNGDPWDSDAALGVRFCRDVKKKVEA